MHVLFSEYSEHPMFNRLNLDHDVEKSMKDLQERKWTH